MKNIGTVELESNRLLFRKASTSDSNAMFNNWANDKEVTKYLRWDDYEKEEDTIKFLNYLENSYKEDNFYNWMVIPKEEGVPIGTIGAVDIDVNNNTVEINTVHNGDNNSLIKSGTFLSKKISNLATTNPIINAIIIPP